MYEVYKIYLFEKEEAVNIKAIFPYTICMQKKL